MADFKLALPTLLKHEGKLSNNSRDPGGITNYGISLRFLVQIGDLTSHEWPDCDFNHDGKIDFEDIKMMTPDQAAKLYQLYFWDPNGYDRIEDQSIATKIFDLSVNLGATGAHKIAQRAVKSAVGLTLEEDGLLGLKTLAAFNMCKPEKLMIAIKSEAAGYYRVLVAQNPHLLEFLNGWLKRAYDDVEIIA